MHKQKKKRPRKYILKEFKKRVLEKEAVSKARQEKKVFLQFREMDITSEEIKGQSEANSEAI